MNPLARPLPTFRSKFSSAPPPRALLPPLALPHSPTPPTSHAQGVRVCEWLSVTHLVLVLDRETLRVLVGDRDVDLDLEGVREGDRVRVDVDVSLDVDVALEVAVSLEVEVPVAVPVPVPVVEGVGDVVTDGEELGLEE